MRITTTEVKLDSNLEIIMQVITSKRWTKLCGALKKIIIRKTMAWNKFKLPSIGDYKPPNVA